MRVGLVVCGDLEFRSGGFRYDRRLLELLGATGHTVEVVSIPWGRYSRQLLDGVSPSFVDHLDRPVDVLLQDGLCHPSLWLANARLERPRAIVSLVHLLAGGPQAGRGRPLYRWVERRYLESVDGVVCPSEDTRRRIGALLGRSDRPAAETLPAIVAPPAGRAECARVDPETVATRARSGPLAVCYLGSVVARKGLHTLLEALATVSRPWTLTVIGSLDVDHEYATRVRHDSVTRGIDDRVRFAGELDDTALRSELASAHVLAVPSRYESFGMAYLEAMEYGVVPIASTVGGASEFITHRRDGFLVPPERPSALVGVLESVATDRTRLARMGRRALETAADHPDWEDSMERIADFLHTMTGT